MSVSPGRELAVAVGACAAAAAATVPLSTPLALVLLAGAGALVAARGRGRAVVGVALAVVGGSVAAAAAATEIHTGWRIAGFAAAVVVAAVGVGAVFRSRRWPSLGTRYERRTVGSDGSRALWEALDRGEDPTA